MAPKIGTAADDRVHAAATLLRPVSDPVRFDLDPLEFGAVRELLLERLSTTLGRRAVERLAPLAADDANEELQVAGELATRLLADDRPPVGGAVEVRSWLPAFFLGEHQPETRDLADLKRLLRASSRCRTWLSSRSGAPALERRAREFAPVGDLADELERVVDDRGEVLSSASVRLAEVRQSIEAAEAGVRAAVARFLSDERMRRCLQSPEPSWRHGRPVFQVRFESRREVHGVQHDRSQSGATVFVEPEVVVDAANRLADARADEHHEIQVVLTHVCRGLRRYQEDIERAVLAMERFDLATARARLIAEDGYCAVPVVVGGPLRLRGALHPVLLRAASARGGTSRETLVPLDLTLGDPHNLLVVTGPNTGGKTVALKTVGLLSIMAACGVPVPASEGSQVPEFDGVFADIGDEQAITQNLSTFSSHVKRIGRCLEGATPRTLVLLDELGAGTDPEEGGALGYAVLEELERLGAVAVVTTHLGRLKEFAFRHTRAENGAMAFDGTTLSPIYRLDVGIPGASHALDIAGRVGLSDALVRRARELLGRRDERLEEVIEKVQVARREAEAERRRVEELKREAESVGEAVAAQKQAVDRQRAWLGEEADAVVAEELRAVRARLDETLKRLANAPKPFGDDARRLLDDLDRTLTSASVHRRRMRFVGHLKKDDVVFVPRLGKRCTVKKVDRVREVITLEVGRLRLEMPFEDVSWLVPLDVS